MTDKEFHRDALIVGGIIIVALLLWLALRGAGTQTIASTTPSPQQMAPQNVFNIPGLVSNYGPVEFPQAVYNFPALANPNQIVNPGYNPVASMTPADCSCGCDGAGNGPTTYSIQAPDFSSVYNTLISSLQSTAAAVQSAELNALGYSEGVFVTNATPTPYQGGNFGSPLGG